eukprot:COSAG06_NODE_3738_length_4958_cov_4.920560_2_plen_69_part_00
MCADLATDGTVQPMANPTSAGFGPDQLSAGDEISITFDAVATSMIEVIFFKAASSTIVGTTVGLGEIR